MSLIDRSTFLARTERRYTTVDIPGFGEIRIQSLTEAERAALESHGVDKRGQPVMERIQEMSARWIIACVVDDTGNRLFADTDLQNIRAIDAAITAAISDACMEHVSASPTDVDTARGN